ncbi:MAG: hypothetical protein ABIR17_09715 [Pseudolysinimonas sp.]|uniref:hypothetical protein n=1 Tax=Pseudolysinimonas sp. TaxID=2680009 RepID=UPI00326613C6
MVTTAQAFSGRWAANRRSWLLTFIPISLLVVFQELSSSFPTFGWIVLSALLQSIAMAVWALTVAAISRALTGRVTLIASGIMWTGIGVARGVVGALVALAAGVDPDWVYRICFWIAVAWALVPIVTYVLAKADESRGLLSQRDAAKRSLAALEASHIESGDARAERMAEALDDSVRPALEEIRAGLATGVHSPSDFDELRARLDTLTELTSSFSVTPQVASQPHLRRVSLLRALTGFELRRPVYAALITGVMTSMLLLPDAIRFGGWMRATEIALAVAVAVAVAIAGGFLLRRFRSRTWLRTLLGRGSGLVAGTAGAAFLVLLPGYRLGAQEIALLVLLPILFAGASTVLALAVGLWSSNGELALALEADQRALDRRRDELRAADDAAAQSLLALVRGDLNGRLAASAMALAFLADGSVDDARRPAILAGVRAHLEGAAAELDALHVPDGGLLR